MRMRLATALICATMPFAIAGANQPANLSGNWMLEASAASGQNFQLGAVAGMLTLQQKDDAVTGTWKGKMPEPWKLTGRVKGSTFELETEVRDVPATRNDEPTTVPRRWIFRGTADGDKMTGSMLLAGGDGDPPAQAFSAERKR